MLKDETHFHKWGEYKRLSPLIPKCILALGVAFMQESQIFKALVEKVNKHQIRPLKYHWKYLKI